MGFKRATESLRVVSVTCDDAIDREKTPILDYVDSRDPALIVELPGKKVTWFTLDPLSGSTQSYVECRDSPLREMMAFQVSCTDCTDRDLLEWKTDRGDRQVKIQCIDVLPTDLVHELGHVALLLGKLDPGEGRAFGLPRGLAVIRTRRPATTVPSAEG